MAKLLHGYIASTNGLQPDDAQAALRLAGLAEEDKNVAKVLAALVYPKSLVK